MKLYTKIVSVLILPLLFVTGCGSEPTQEVMTCTRTLNQNNVKMDFAYKVYYTEEYVDVIETTEIVESENTTYLETVKTTVENTYAPYKDIEYYNYDVKVEGNKLTSTTKIEYDKIDTTKLIELDSANGQLIKDGKIKITDVQSVYEGSFGATCSK